MYDLIIIGGGPAGLTAATYASRAGKSALIIEKNGFGGQISHSPRVENFPGFLSVSGVELGDRMLEQAMEQGAEVELDEVTQIEGGCVKRVKCLSGAELEAKAVIIATGAKPKMLALADEQRLIGSGVSFCALCDGAFYKNKPVAVCGGGNSALQDALLLSETSSRVYVIHRRGSFRGEAKLVEELSRRGNVEFVLNASVEALIGENGLEAVTVTGGRRIAVEGLFVCIGHEPDTAAFSSLIELDGKGYAASGEDCITRSPGVFVAGDCRRKSVRQVTTAVADGAIAAIAACNYIDSLN